jgi:hypothetical protein
MQHTRNMQSLSGIKYAAHSQQAKFLRKQECSKLAKSKAPREASVQHICNKQNSLGSKCAVCLLHAKFLGKQVGISLTTCKQSGRGTAFTNSSTLMLLKEEKILISCSPAFSALINAS